jgi:hypothetical protein
MVDRPDGEAAPLRKLSRHETTYECVVYDRCHVDVVAGPKKAIPACIDA